MRRLYILILIALLVPSFAFASWWNPFSWGIFSSPPRNSTGTPISTTTVYGDNAVKEISSTTRSSLTKEAAKVIPPTVSVQTTIVPAQQTQKTNTSIVLAKREVSVETKNSLLAKMSSLKNSVEDALSRIAGSDSIRVRLSFIDSKIRSEIANLYNFNYPTEQQLTDSLSQYSALLLEYNSLPPIIFSVSGMGYSVNTTISGRGLADAVSAYILPVNLRTTDIPINLPIFDRDSSTVYIKLADVNISPDRYNMYVVNSSGKTSTPFMFYVDEAMTPQREQQMSNSAIDSPDCITAQKSLNTAVQGSLTDLEQTYRQRVQFYCY